MDEAEQEVIWQPQAGPQTALLSCPVPDVFFGGARGGGKTDALLGDWLAHAHRHGKNARGLLVRRTLPELDDVIRRALEIYPRLGWVWQSQAKTWTHTSGASLRLRYLETEADASRYQGHQYTWIGVDEAGNYDSSRPIDILRACMRSAAGVPCQIRITGNPGGVGQEWLRQRYVDPAKPMTPFRDPSSNVMRVFIPSRVQDNRLLMDADPTYLDRLRAATMGQDHLLAAWLEGDWNAQPSGGEFDAAWIKLHDKPPEQIAKELGLVPNFYLDLASREKQLDEARGPDRSVIVVAARDQLDRIWILDVYAEAVRADTLLDQAIAMRKRWKPRRIKGEAGAIRNVLDAVLAERWKAIGQRLFVLDPIQAPGDKVQRAQPLRALMRGGGLNACRGQTWWPKLVGELNQFPLGRFDDQVDALAYAAIDLQDIRKGEVPTRIAGFAKDGEVTGAQLELLVAKAEKRRKAEADGFWG